MEFSSSFDGKAAMVIVDERAGRAAVREGLGGPDISVNNAVAGE